MKGIKVVFAESAYLDDITEREPKSTFLTLHGQDLSNGVPREQGWGSGYDSAEKCEMGPFDVFGNLG